MAAKRTRQEIPVEELLLEELWDRDPEHWTGEHSYHAYRQLRMSVIHEVLSEVETFEDALPVLIQRVGCQEHPVPLYGPTEPVACSEER